MKSYKKLRCDSYEATLTPKQLKQLHAWLLDHGLPQKEVSRRCWPWPGGKRAGRRPCPSGLAKIGRRLRMEAALNELEAAASVKEAAMLKMLREAAPGALHEGMVNVTMMHIAQEVVQKTLQGLDPSSRTAAAKLLLERSNQGLDRAKFMLEVQKYQAAAAALKEKKQADGVKPSKSGGIPPEVMEQVEKELQLL
jgi:hypothetical protein